MKPAHLVSVVVLVAALLVPAGASGQSPNPLASGNWFVDEKNDSWIEWQRAERQGRENVARVNREIAIQPKFRWFGRSTKNLAVSVSDYIARAESKGQIPLMAMLRHHGTSCSPSYTGGGAAEDEVFRAWWRVVANAIGNHRVVVGYEPDSLGTVDCLKKSRRKARIAALRYGVDLLSKLPNATVYIEAGASDWERPARTAKLLKQVGIDKVRGFMLNATHYDWTANNIRYGRAVSRRTGGKPFIINTSGNGRGPVHYQRWTSSAHTSWQRVNIWCNAKMRGLGIAPTTQTHDPLVDAYMWINRPGASSGACNGGKKPSGVGSWSQTRANMWVRYRTNWLRPPKGTRHGHFSKPSIYKLGPRRFIKRVKRGY